VVLLSKQTIKTSHKQYKLCVQNNSRNRDEFGFKIHLHLQIDDLGLGNVNCIFFFPSSRLDRMCVVF